MIIRARKRMPSHLLLRSEAKDVVQGGAARALDLAASPDEEEVLKFLQSVFTMSDQEA